MISLDAFPCVFSGISCVLSDQSAYTRDRDFRPFSDAEDAEFSKCLWHTHLFLPKIKLPWCIHAEYLPSLRPHLRVLVEIGDSKLAEVDVLLNTGFGVRSDQNADIKKLWPKLSNLKWMHVASAGNPGCTVGSNPYMLPLHITHGICSGHWS